MGYRKPALTNIKTTDASRSVNFSYEGVGGNLDIWMDADGNLRVDLYRLDANVVVRASWDDGRRLDTRPALSAGATS